MRLVKKINSTVCKSCSTGTYISKEPGWCYLATVASGHLEYLPILKQNVEYALDINPTDEATTEKYYIIVHEGRCPYQLNYKR